MSLFHRGWSRGDVVKMLLDEGIAGQEAERVADGAISSIRYQGRVFTMVGGAICALSLLPVIASGDLTYLAGVALGGVAVAIGTARVARAERWSR